MTIRTLLWTAGAVVVGIYAWEKVLKNRVG